MRDTNLDNMRFEIEEFIWDLLIGRSVTKKESVQLIREGLPINSLIRTIEYLDSLNLNEVLTITGISSRSYAQYRKTKKCLNPYQSDRLYRLVKILAHAVYIFQDKNIAINWLSAKSELFNLSPISLLDTDIGSANVSSLLRRIQHGVYS